jgi:hypothetical protein
LKGFNAARAAKCPGAIRQWLCRDRNERMSVLAGNLRSARRKIFLRQRKEGNGRVGEEVELIFAPGLWCVVRPFFFQAKWPFPSNHDSLLNVSRPGLASWTGYQEYAK